MEYRCHLPEVGWQLLRIFLNILGPCDRFESSVDPDLKSDTNMISSYVKLINAPLDYANLTSFSVTCNERGLNKTIWKEKKWQHLTSAKEMVKIT